MLIDMKRLCAYLLFWLPILGYAFDFNVGSVKGLSATDVISLRFGPEGLLYLAEREGNIKVFEVMRHANADYSATEIETIEAGFPITAFTLTGTENSPVIYISHSNGTMAQYSWNGVGWDQTDLVRGLPYVVSSIQIDSDVGAMYLAVNSDLNRNNGLEINGVLEVDLGLLHDYPDQIDANGSTYKINLETSDAGSLEELSLTADNALSFFAATQQNSVSILLANADNKQMYSLTHEMACNPDMAESEELFLASHLRTVVAGSIDSASNLEDCMGVTQPQQALASFPSAAIDLEHYSFLDNSGIERRHLIVAVESELFYQVEADTDNSSFDSFESLPFDFGSSIIDVTAASFDSQYPGTLWIVMNDDISVLEPTNVQLTASETDVSDNELTEYFPTAKNTATSGNLLHHWSFDESSGLTLADAAGDQSGRLLNGPIWQPQGGKYAGALKFDGVNDYVDLGKFNVSGSAISFALWIKPDELRDENDARFISKAVNDSVQGHHWMLSSGGWNGKYLRFRLKTGQYTKTLISKTGVLQTDKWQHVAATYNGSRMRLYLNGQQIASTAKTGSLAVGDVSVALANQPLGAGSRPYKGRLDDMRIYNRALTSQEIQQIMNDAGTTISEPVPPSLPPEAECPDNQVCLVVDKMDTGQYGSNYGSNAHPKSLVVNVETHGSETHYFAVTGYDIEVNREVAVYADGTHRKFLGFLSKGRGDRVNSGDIFTLPGNLLSAGKATVEFRCLTGDSTWGVTNLLLSKDNTSSPPADDVAPIVSLTAPTPNQKLSGTVQLQASATDNIGVVGVQFLRNGSAMGEEDTNPPFTLTWDTTRVYDGNHSLRVRARDAAGNVSTTGVVTAIVENTITPPTDETAPAVSLLSPTPNQTLSGTVQLQASATDNVGVVGVQFLRNDSVLGAELTKSPYTLAWNTTQVADGSYQLKVRARDAAGNVSTTGAVTVTVENIITPPTDETAPVVDLLSPTPNQTLSGTVQLQASATDNVGVVGVQFLRNDSVLDEELTKSPYTLAWNTTQVADGSYQLKVRARDAAGNVSITGATTVTVENIITPPIDETAPVVGLLSPTSNQKLSGTVQLQATATDNVGVVGVQFLRNGSVLGAELTKSPYILAWNTTQVADGSHQLGVRARDAAGNVSATGAITVIVENQTNSGGGEINVSLTPSRTSGVAPLAVFFDASATTAISVSRPFHDLHYAWNFGDAGSGTWNAVAGRSKNTDTGPMAAHVFETPGTYTVTLSVRDQQGHQESKQVTITAQDPNTVFSDTSTVCISKAGAFSGCPAGALNVTTSSFSVAMDHLASGKRLLFRKGESWTTSSSNTINIPGPGMIGAYGSGDKPAIHFVGSDELFRLSGGSPNFSDWRFVDLEIFGGSSSNDHVFKFEGSVKQVLMLRLYMHDLWRSIVGDESAANYYFRNGYPEQTLNDVVAVVDSKVANTSGNGATLSAQRMIVMGNIFEHSNVHGLRPMWVEHGVINHNYFHDAASGRHLLKLHAPKWHASGMGFHRYSENVLISANIFQGTASAWPVVVGPQDSNSDERLRNILIEKNVLYSSTDTQIGIRSSGSDTTIRNNIFDLTGGPSWVEAIAVSRRGIEPAPLRTFIYNNAVYNATGNARLAEPHSDTVVINNIVHAPLGDATVGCSSATCTNNLTVDPLWVDPDRSDFTLRTGSAAIDAADKVSVPIIDDFVGNIRPNGSADSGPYERF